MKNLRKLTIAFFLFMLWGCIGSLQAATLPVYKYALDDIEVYTQKDTLIVRNSMIERKWKLTPFGLTTISIENRETKKRWEIESITNLCDWSYEGIIDGKQKGNLISLFAHKNNDEGFTDWHTEVIAEFEYPDSKASIKYTVWIYPSTQGIRTQSFIKGDISAIETSNKETATKSNPYFRLRTGNNNSGYSAAEFGTLWHASNTQHNKAVEYQAFNLDATKKYKLGVSWWDFEGENRKQQVRLTSVDGESDFVVIAPQFVPGYKNNKQMAQEFIVDIPEAVLTDGSFRIYIDNMNNAKTAVVSEIWLYETGSDPQAELMGEEIRIEQLTKHTPKGFTLAAYFDSGQKNPDEIFISRGNVDFLPVDAMNVKRIYAGYNNDTQHRNSELTPILKEERRKNPIKTKEENWWASILAVEKDNEGILMVKESHKCVNQYGVETGSFIITPNGVTNTGTSIAPNEISPDKYKWFWGSWIIPYQGGDFERQMALKKFDRKRYPVNVERDMYSLVCTWGHSKNQRDGRNYATEAEVLKEMDYVKEINVDLLLIDDGWQSSLKNTTATPDEGQGWKPAPSIYPQGWKNVKNKADKLGLKLGLWGVAQEMPATAMIWNWEQIKMNQLKLDFASFGTHSKLSDMMDSVRYFIKSVDHKSSISWDLTENAARYGYYWAREYGNLHFMNRKPFLPLNVLYVPHLALRDYWQLAHYSNLNKYQLTIQHAKATDPQSDANKHSETYCVATGLMGIPEFMAMPRFYGLEDRKKVGDLMNTYKTAQKHIFTGYVFPIGNEPNNKSWCGFQSINKNNSQSGFLTIFRELHNINKEQTIKLHSINAKQKIKITNLLTNREDIVEADENGCLKFEINHAPDFLFLKWTIVK